jgi:hypothetical protein
MNKQIALDILAECEFKPFTKADWMGFAGCESKFPLICDNRDDYVIVMDGGTFSFYPLENAETDGFGDEWYCFNLGDML